MIPFLPLLGLPESLRKPVAYIGTAVALIALLWLLRGCYDRRVEANYRAKIEAQASQAREQAADERASDAATNTRTEHELHNAIDAAQSGGSLSPAAHALACQRLRNAGRFPAACRSAGGDGAQAGAH